MTIKIDWVLNDQLAVGAAPRKINDLEVLISFSNKQIVNNFEQRKFKYVANAY